MLAASAARAPICSVILWTRSEASSAAAAVRALHVVAGAGKACRGQFGYGIGARFDVAVGTGKAGRGEFRTALARDSITRPTLSSRAAAKSAAALARNSMSWAAVPTTAAAAR